MPNKKISDFATVTSIQNDDKFLMNSAGTTSTVTLNTLRDTVTNNSIKLPSPASNGQILTYNGTTWIAATAPSTNGGMFGTAVTITSVPSVEWTNIPNWVVQITIIISEVSTDNASSLRLQVGNAGGWIIDSYRGAQAGLTNSSTAATSYLSDGFGFNSNDTLNTLTHNGIGTLVKLNSDIWGYSGVYGTSNGQARQGLCGGAVNVTDLNRIRITTSLPTGTIDSGLATIYMQ